MLRTGLPTRLLNFKTLSKELDLAENNLIQSLITLQRFTHSL